MILSASVMIVVGAIIRIFTIDRLPKWTFIVIWILVSVRLLVPFSLPVAFVDLQFSRPSTIVDSVEGTTNLPQATTVGGEWVPILPFYDAGQTVEPFASGGINLTAILIGIWVLGSVVFASYFFIVHYKFREKMCTSLPVENEYVSKFFAIHKTWRKIQVRQLEQICSPLTYGFLRPVILLPTAMNFDDEQRINYILMHELIHVKRFDYVWKILFTITLCVHWFNPLVWLMCLLVNRDIELACDEKVLKIFGWKARAGYGLTLLDMAEAVNGQFTPIYNSFSQRPITERINVMVKSKKTSMVGAVVALAVVLGSMAIFSHSSDISANTRDIMPVAPEVYNVIFAGEDISHWVYSSDTINNRIENAAPMSFGDPLPRAGYIRRTISNDYMFYMSRVLEYYGIAQPSDNWAGVSLEDRWNLTGADPNDQWILRNAQRIQSGDASLIIEEVIIYDEVQDQFFIAYVNFIFSDPVWDSHYTSFNAMLPIGDYRWW